MYEALVASLSALCLCPLLQAQPIQFKKAEDAVVVRRLQSLPQKNTERADGVRLMFEQAGCSGDRLAVQPVNGAQSPNIICVLPGKRQETIVIGAHHDRAPQGMGAVDNWSGASLLPSLYESLAGSPREFTFVFAGFAAEEAGLRGSESYLKQMDKESRGRIRAYVNLDCLGMTSTKVWVSRSDRLLMQLAARVAKGLKLPLDGVNVEKVGDSDSLSFVERKIPVIDFHSSTQETVRVLHSNRDMLAAIQLPDYLDTYKLLAGFLTVLDIALAPPSEALTPQEPSAKQ